IMESPQALARNEIPGDMKLNGIITARKGIIERQPRGGKIKKFSFTLEDKVQVLKTKLIGHLEKEPFTGLLIDDERIHFRVNKGAARMMRERAGITTFSAASASRFSFTGRSVQELFPRCIERQQLVRTATTAVERYQADSGTMLGPIAFNHVVTTHARQPDHTKYTLPDDNTTRQAIALDDVAAQLAAEVPGEQQVQVATIRLEINGTWNNFRVDITSLRAALGLPAYEIFTRGIFHGFVPVDASTQDLNDTDHMPSENASS
ncbi:hypothetical protein GN958_ATG17177, partial [Phytophthora infestans]